MAAFDAMGPNPRRADVVTWLEAHFEPAGSDVLAWVPPDWQPSPLAIQRIDETDLRDWALGLNAIWKDLGKQLHPRVREHPERYSVLQAPNPWVAPGGRFREFYYWDSFWVVRGLLVCGMKESVRLMLENMLWTVDRYGFVPNGARVYYENRAQPPMLTLMVDEYVAATKDVQFLERAVPLLEAEHAFWANTSEAAIEVVSSSTGTRHTIARYIADIGSPRPEGYYEDYTLAKDVAKPEDRARLLRNIAAGAASGWDFSTRWLRSGMKLQDIITTSVMPVDLNAILYAVESRLAEMHKTLGHAKQAA
jgi:alpha,alpha-trehalase